MSLIDCLKPQNPPRIVGARVIKQDMEEPRHAPQVLINPRDYPRVLKMRQNGYKLKDIAKRMGVSASQVRRLCIRLGAS